MKIDFVKNGGEMTVSLNGRLDTVTAPDLETVLSANYDGISSIVFNCEELSYISSAGLRVLLSAHKRMKGGMKLVSVSELVREVLEMTGFADIWVIA